MAEGAPQPGAGGPQRSVPPRQGARSEGQRSPGAKYVTLYPVEYHGIPLAKGSDYPTIVSEDGRLLATRERHLPVTVDATAPTTAPAAAVEVGRQHAAEAFAADTTQASEPTLEIWVDDQLKGHLTWAFSLQSATLTDPKARRYWVTAVVTPQVLHWESEIYHAHFGTISATLW